MDHGPRVVKLTTAIRNRRTGFGMLVLLLAGCTRWEPYVLPATPSPELPSSLRLWSTAGPATQLSQPYVHGDTVYGRSRGDTVGVALREIDRAARPRLDAARTTGAVVGGLAAWIAVGVAAGGLE
jgi:hypothetical protein